MPTIYQIAMPIMAVLIGGGAYLYTRLASAAFDKKHPRDEPSEPETVVHLQRFLIKKKMAEQQARR